MATTVASPSDASAQRTGRRITLWHVTIFFLVVAMLASGYLSYIKLFGGEIICIENSSIFDCARVENSRWAWILGIPTAVVGFTWYTLIGAVLLGEKKIPVLKQNGVVIVFGMALFAFVYHTYLTYTAAFVIGALCPWCLTAHGAMTMVFLLTTARLIRQVRANNAAAA